MNSYHDHLVRLRSKSGGVPHLHLLSFLLLLLSLPYASAQSDSNSASPQYPYTNLSSSMTTLVVIFIFLFFLFALISVFVHCADSSEEWSSNSTSYCCSFTARFWKRRHGLRISLVESFPTFSFSEIKDRKIANAGIECVVCISELDNGEILRLLPNCGHVFHRGCIDTWISSHTTCPVCRTDLSKTTARKQTGEHMVVAERVADVGETENQISITISNDVHNITFPSKNLKPGKGKLGRSRSTGDLDIKVKHMNRCSAFSSDNEGGSESSNQPGGEGSNQENGRSSDVGC